MGKHWGWRSSEREGLAVDRSKAVNLPQAVRWRWAALAPVTIFVTLAVGVPAEAQQVLAVSGPQHDRVRVSGFIWRGKPSGTVDFQALSEIPGFETGVDLGDTLGLTDPDNGWIIEGNVAAGRRHRFIVELARLENTAEASIEVGNVPPFVDLVVQARSTVELREFHAYYNLLFVAVPEVEAGLLTGVGWFEATAGVRAQIGAVSASIDQAFPTFGGNLLVYPKGPVRGYLEVTGFPRITIEELTGTQLDVVARAEVFVIPNLGLMIGYRRYRLAFDVEGHGIALDVNWSGLTFGAQARF